MTIALMAVPEQGINNMGSVDRIDITDGLNISRALTGLWQVADMERGGNTLDPDIAAAALADYVRDGFTTFDMADHYGSAEIIAGRLIAAHAPEGVRPQAITKWCPPPGPITADVVRAGVQERLDRLEVDCIDLLQFHWWSFEHPAWLDALHEMNRLRDEGLIGELGVTNFDAAHLHLALADGIPLRTNQVSFSLIDRRGSGPLAQVCIDHGVKLLAYGTICGGFLSDKWVGVPEPDEIPDWSKMKYHRFIQAAGGWDAYQRILQAADQIAKKHQVSVTNVATRWVLQQNHVAGVIIGARPGENQHRANNLALFRFALDDEDQALLQAAFDTTSMIPGDCGEEYRKPPFLTASGDLSDHLDSIPTAYSVDTHPWRPQVTRAHTGSIWEDLAGYCRAQRIGDRILVSGTTATAGADRVVAKGDAAAQATFVIDKIIGAIKALGGDVNDIVRTRIYLTNIADTAAVSRVHGRVFGDIKPANTLLAIDRLAGDYLLEIEAEAIVTSDA